MTGEEYGIAYKKGFTLTVRFLVSRGLSFDIAQETAQAAWVKGWGKIDQLREPRMILTWMNSIALNIHRSFRRREPFIPEELIVHPSFFSNIGKEIEAKEALRLASPPDRAILEAHYLQGESVKKIAATSGRTETAIRIRLLRARRRVKIVLEAKQIRPIDHRQSHIGEIMNGAPQDIKVSLSSGMRILIAGNGVSQFQKQTPDGKIILWDIPEINRLIEAPEQVRVPNLQTLIILRGMRERQTLAVQNFGRQNGIEIKYTDNKGQITRLMEQIRSSQTTDPVPPPPLLGGGNNPAQQPSLEEILKNLENLYIAHGSNSKATINHVRSLGFGKDKITDGALYQRVRNIGIRRGDIPNPRKDNGTPAQPTVAYTPSLEVLLPSRAKELLEAIEQAKAANQRVLELAAVVANENAHLQEKVDSVRKLFGS